MKNTAEPWIAKQNSPTEWVVMRGHIVIALFNRKDNPQWNEANAKRIVSCVNSCAGINPEAVPDMKKALYFLGGGDIYLEEFGRLCFCSGCRIGEKGPINKGIHSSACGDAWEAYAKAKEIKQ